MLDKSKPQTPTDLTLILTRPGFKLDRSTSSKIKLFGAFNLKAFNANPPLSFNS